MAAEEQFACSDSTLRLPIDAGAEPMDYIKQCKNRYENPGGSCRFAQAALRDSASLEHIVQDCPAFMKKMHAQGAPTEIKCAIQLIGFASATND